MSKPVSKDITRRSFVAAAAISAALVGTACTLDGASTDDAVVSHEAEEATLPP